MGERLSIAHLLIIQFIKLVLFFFLFWDDGDLMAQLSIHAVQVETQTSDAIM